MKHREQEGYRDSGSKFFFATVILCGLCVKNEHFGDRWTVIRGRKVRVLQMAMGHVWHYDLLLDHINSWRLGL